MLELSRLFDLAAGRLNPITVGRLPKEGMDYLGARLGLVYLSKESFDHIMTEHPTLTWQELLRIPEALTRGMLLTDRDRPNCVAISYQCPDTNLRYKLA